MKYFLTADIGGTNPRLAILNEKSEIIIKENITHEKLIQQINDFLKICGEKDITTDTLCIAAAGIINKNICKLTNADLLIDSKEILEQTLLSNIYLINDFEAIGHAINSEKTYVKIKSGVVKNGNKIVVGVGTGLGCSVITKENIFATEACYLELETNFDKSENHYIENIISGKGIEKLYYSKYQETALAKDAIKDRKVQQEFVKHFAKLLKNLTFAYLPQGGIYLTGGVLQKNHKILNKEFVKEFTAHFNKDIKKLLKDIPVFLIKDYDISLHGCLNYILKQKNN